MCDQKFRKFLVQKRKSLGFSQSSLAVKVGVGKSTIGHIESGLFSRFPSKKVRKLAEALQVNPEEFTKMWIDAVLSSYREELERKIVCGE